MCLCLPCFTNVATSTLRMKICCGNKNQEVLFFYCVKHTLGPPKFDFYYSSILLFIDLSFMNVSLCPSINID